MKITRKLLLIALLASFVFAVYSKDDDNTEPQNNKPADGTMTLKTDGTDWSASLALMTSHESGVLTITGSDNNAHQCQVIVYNPNGAGTEVSNTQGSFSATF